MGTPDSSATARASDLVGAPARECSMFQPSQHDVRRFFCEAWARHVRGEPMAPMDLLAAQWAQEHPEYRADLSDLEAALAASYTVEDGRTNPFLHLAMHLSISEQCSIDQPTGIRAAVEQLAARSLADGHPLHLEPVVGAVHGIHVAARGPGDHLAMQRQCVHLLLVLAQRGLDHLLALLRVGLDAGLRGQRVELVVLRRCRSCRRPRPFRRGCAAPASAWSRHR
jgi:hypothetical protein